MKPCVAVLALLALFVVPLGVAAEEEPTREQVLEALEAWAGREVDPFPGWGDAAMPHLEALANTSDGLRLAPGLIRAVRTIATERAVGLYVRFLKGRTQLPGFVAVMLLGPATRDDPFLRGLLEHEEFKDALLRYLRGDVAEAVLALCALAGWKDQVPRIRELLKDPRVEVREAAASALASLTGELPEVDRPGLRLPRKALVPGLVGEPAYVPRQARRDPIYLGVLPWFDGTPRLVAGFDAGIPSFGHRGELHVSVGARGERERWPFPHDVQKLVTAPAGRGVTQLIGLVSQEHRAGRSSNWEIVGAWSDDGTERWTWNCDERFLDDIALLHGEDGPVGVAVGLGGDLGVIALDLDGDQTWQTEAGGVLHVLCTHPELPGHLIAVQAWTTLFRHSEAVFESRRKLASRGLFEDRGLLFPAGNGTPSYVLAGKREQTGEPALCRFDAGGRRLWEARLPAEITALEMLEAEGAPRLLFATTDQGELYVLDDSGTLRWRGDLPFARKDGGVETELLAVGAIGPGEHAILVKQIQSCYVIPVHVGRLQERIPVSVDGSSDPGGE